MDYQFIDCYCSIGEKANPLEDILYRKEDIRKRMESLNVKKAFCFHNSINSNELLKDELESDGFFIPSYTFNPKYTQEELEKLFKEYNAKMINMNPIASEYSLDIETLGEYFGIMNSYSAVITIPLNSAKKEQLDKILNAFRNLSIIIVNSNFTDITHIKELMQKFDNIHIDTGYTSLYGLESIVNKYGSERIFFSSYMPEIDLSGAVGRIIMSPIKDSDKENIAYKNISSLTGVNI